MNLRKLRDEIFLEGGISYNINTGQVNPESGYMVSIRGYEESFNVDKFSDKDIQLYTLKHADMLSDTSKYIGGWLDRDNYNVVLDVSINIEDVKQACYIGIINRQTCIYDCRNKRYIHLPSPQTSGTETQQKAYAKMKAEQLAYLLETTGVE